MDFLYFNIYRWYFRKKTDGREVDPQGLTSMWFGICVCGWLLLGKIVYSQYFQRSITELTMWIITFVGFTTYAMVYNYYRSSDTSKSN